MRIWLITVGEPLPLGVSADRLIRTGQLARYLSARGNDVVWWSSTFDHIRKKHHFDRACDIQLDSGLSLKLLHAPPYKSNVSLRRIRHQYVTARAYSSRAGQEPAPDVLLCSYPTIELSRAAVAYAGANRLPIALDVRDLWPDIYLDGLPRALRPVGAPAIWAYNQLARATLRKADGLVGISDGYLAWALKKAGRRRSAEFDAVLPIGFQRPDIPERDLAAARRQLVARGVNFEKVLAVFVGTFGRTYDLSTVIDAARMVELSLPNLQFVLAGEGDNGPRWRAEARGLSNVSMPGWLGKNETAALCASASIGLQSYTAIAPQGLANKLFEYLGYGLALVSSLGGENAQLVERHRCGANYHPGDAESLRALLTELLTVRDRLESARRNSRALFEREFELSTIHDRFADYLSRLSRVAHAGLQLTRARRTS